MIEKLLLQDSARLPRVQGELVLPPQYTDCAAIHLLLGAQTFQDENGTLFRKINITFKRCSAAHQLPIYQPNSKFEYILFD